MLKTIPLSQWTDAHRAHLLNRAGFGKAPAHAAPNSKAAPEAWVDRLLDVPPQLDPSEAPEWTTEPLPSRKDFKGLRDLPDKERRAKIKEQQKKMRTELSSLRIWWLDRMLKSEEPLQEKMTLFWHGHFVSSSQKVKQSRLHWKQNNLFRYQGMSSFRDLTISVGRDPAMLQYLDGAKSKKGSPNENYARELMELFTLGEGHYTEEDIKESARAFTGWTSGRFSDDSTFRSNLFDSGEKEFLGETGNFNDKDIVNIILKQEQSAKYICKKLWEFYAYTHPEPEIVDALASTFRKHDYQIKPVLREMFLSQPFYSKQAVRTQIKSPVMWLVSLARVLDIDPFPARIGLRMMDSLGQELLNPPSVKGWDGGRSWVSTSTLILRNNLAHLLINGGKPGAVGLNARGIGQIPADALEVMSEQEKERIQQMQNRGKNFTLPSFLRNEALTAAWQQAATKDKLPLLVRTVYQGPISPNTYRDLETNPKLMLGSEDPQRTLQQNIYELVAHPEFQLT